MIGALLIVAGYATLVWAWGWPGLLVGVIHLGVLAILPR